MSSYVDYETRQRRMDEEYREAGGGMPAIYRSEATQFFDEIHGTSAEPKIEDEASVSSSHGEFIAAAGRLILLPGTLAETTARVALLKSLLDPDIPVSKLLNDHPGLRRHQFSNARVELASMLSQWKEAGDESES